MFSALQFASSDMVSELLVELGRFDMNNTGFMQCMVNCIVSAVSVFRLVLRSEWGHGPWPKTPDQAARMSQLCRCVEQQCCHAVSRSRQAVTTR
eukprot:8840632-Alexandrium_andersonii.AAC.1